LTNPQNRNQAAELAYREAFGIGKKKRFVGLPETTIAKKNNDAF